jgi:hypothetical protein
MGVASGGFAAALAVRAKKESQYSRDVMQRSWQRVRASAFGILKLTACLILSSYPAINPG